MSNLSDALEAMDKATLVCGNWTDYEKSQVHLIATHCPYSRIEVARIYQKCGKSFDKTIKAIELGIAYNDMERGIREATKDDALAFIKEALPWLEGYRAVKAQCGCPGCLDTIPRLDALIARAKPEEGHDA